MPAGTKSELHRKELKKSLLNYYATGQKVTREYTLMRKVWNEMKRRCNDSNHLAYHNYGGRGIRISKTWLSFDNFYKDMYPTYKIGLSIDRIDNSKGYKKSNCRWATRKEQMQNFRGNHRFLFDNSNLTLTEWADKIGVNRRMLSQRIYKNKWSIEKALTTPKRNYPI